MSLIREDRTLDRVQNRAKLGMSELTLLMNKVPFQQVSRTWHYSFIKMIVNKCNISDCSGQMDKLTRDRELHYPQR